MVSSPVTPAADAMESNQGSPKTFGTIPEAPRVKPSQSIEAPVFDVERSTKAAKTNSLRRPTSPEAPKSPGLANGSLVDVPSTLTALIGATTDVEGTHLRPAHGRTDSLGPARSYTASNSPQTVKKEQLGFYETREPLRSFERIRAATRSRIIRKKVTDACRPSFPDIHRRILSDARLQQLIKPEAVVLELSRSEKNSIHVDDPRRFCKVLAILYLLDLSSKLRLFVQANLCDADLPLDIREDAPGDGAVLKSRHSSSGAQVRFKKHRDADDFTEKQWTVLAYVFSQHQGSCVPHYKLTKEVILPFHWQRQSKTTGGSGDVYHTRIYPEHHCWESYKVRVKNDKKGKSNVFAIKTLQSKDKDVFDQEVKILRKLSKDNHKHPHLITLLATYEQNTHSDQSCRYSLIFPLAEADLFGLWKLRPNPPKTKAIALWLARQCRGLAEGLRHIHHWETFSGSSLLSYSEKQGGDDHRAAKSSAVATQDDHGPLRLIGRHGDVKPENILWFPDSRTSSSYGTLKLTDFGIAKFSKEYSRQGRMPNSPSYRSPEYELNTESSPGCDVWALGCVFLELTTWFCGGQTLLKQFGKDRLAPDGKLEYTASDGQRQYITSDTFFVIEELRDGRRVPRIKTAVPSALKTLKRHPVCQKFGHLQELLIIIEEHMLVVHPAEREDHNELNSLSLRQTTSKSRLARRKSSGDVLRFLGGMTVFDDEQPEYSRQNTHNTLASEVQDYDGAFEIISTIPGILRQSTLPISKVAP